jgi:phosphate transport system protein
MSKHLQQNLDLLMKEIITLAYMVEDATNKALLALHERRPELAEEVIDGDDLIDQKEVRIEEECLKLLALHQPVAADLRFIISVIKVNNDLERIGDLATNIAKRAKYLSRHDQLQITLDFQGMSVMVCKMLRSSLDSLSDRNTTLALKVLAMDDEVDDMNRQMFKSLQKTMQDDPNTVKRAVQFLSVSRHLERIGDLATNIAEDVVYMVEGELIRHKLDAPLDDE